MNLSRNSNADKKALVSRTHDFATSNTLNEFMKKSWAPSPLTGVSSHPSTTYTKLRREKLSQKYSGVRLVFPAGSLKVRSND